MLLEFIDQIVKEELDQLFETVMDNLTTEVSRYVISHLKNYNNVRNILNLKFLYKGTNFNILFQISENSSVSSHGHFEPPNIVNIVINLPIDFYNSNNLWNELILSLKTTLRHELEHLQQHLRHTKKHGRYYGKNYTTDKVFKTHGNLNSIPYEMDRQDTKDVEYWKKYLANPMEIEAFVMGLYKKSKMEKEDFWFVMHNFLMKKQEMMRELLISKLESEFGRRPNPKFSEVYPKGVQALEDYFDNLEITWSNYAKTRLPTKNIKFDDE